MRPKLLKVSGLNSFVEEEVIDFSSLSKKSLFGIFGPTGSGKSSILDAVTIALYGRISRDTKEFINKETEELYVFFEFSIGSDNIYKVERKLQISDTGGYKTSLSRLVVNENGQEEIYDKVGEIDDKMAEIIGLNHEDFMRTVVLPQGKFSRFLKLTGRDRRDMLERILGLEEFGERLMRKLKKQRNVRNKKTNQIEAVLNKYEEVSAEKLKEEKTKLSELKSKYKDISGDLKEKTKEYDKYKQIRKLQEELEAYEEKEKKLTEGKEEIEAKKSRLQKVEKAVSIKSDLKRYNECSSKIKNNKKELNETVEEIFQLSIQKDKIIKEYEGLLARKDRELPQLAEKKVKAKDAIKLEEKNKGISNIITEKEEEIKGLSEKQERLQSDLQIIKDKINEQKTQIENKEEKQEELQVSSDYRKAVASGLKLENDFKQKEKQLREIRKEKEGLADNIKEEKEKITELKQQLKKLEAGILQSCEQEVNDKKNEREKLGGKLADLEDNLESAKNQLEKLKQEIEEIEEKNMAGALAGNLREGKPCPVCGSISHPEVAEEIDVNLSERKEERDKLDGVIEKLQNDKTQISSNLKITENNIDSFKKERDSLIDSFTNKLTDLKELQITELSPRDKLKKDRNEIKNTISTLTGSLNTNKKNLQEVVEKLNKQQKLVEELKKEYSQNLERLEIVSFTKENMRISRNDEQMEKIQMELKTVKKGLKENKGQQQSLQESLNERDRTLIKLKNELKNLQEDFVDNEKEIKQRVAEKDPKKYLQEVNKREKQLKLNVEKKKKERDKVKDKLNTKENRKSTLEDRLERLQDEEDKLLLLLNDKIREYNFKDIEQARSYLDREKDIKKWEQEIEDYEKQERDIKNNIKRLTDKLDGDSISREKWAKIREEKSNLEDKQEKLQENIGGQKKTIEKLKEDLEDKKQKIKDKEELDHELSLIKEINDLVRGKSFVEFVAARQLRYIAREASKSLMEITNNRYRLELNEQGEFVICDLYNGGVKRGCNTLSGGETFLTSLSLALALSSQIQLKGSSSMEFFFLDEGFGTLDNNLLDVVMNSLEKLQDENLSVGIISHVEELKNRVPIKLMVEPAQPGIRGTKVEIKYT